MAGIRIKSEWFRQGAPRPAAQSASAMAFIVWRVGQHLLKRMRAAHFDIDAGEPYFAFTREVLVYLALAADRHAHRMLEPELRADFSVAMVRRLSEILADNEDDLLGLPPPGRPGHAERFIDLFNQLAPEYGEFGFDERDDAPDFLFMRFLASRIEPLVPEKDRAWVRDQVIGVEAPEGAALVRKGMQGLFTTRARRERRAASTGE